MTEKHPLIVYAQAIIISNNGLNSVNDITREHLRNALSMGITCFRLYPKTSYDGKSEVYYDYKDIEKGNPGAGIFLSPNVISTNKQASKIRNAALELIKELDANKSLDAKGDVSMSIAPSAGEYLSFSDKGGIGRGKPKLSLMDRCLCIITALSIDKPCFQTPDGNVCIIPNLPIQPMIDFVTFFRIMCKSKLATDLLKGKVEEIISGKGKNKKVEYKPKRPSIFRGNYPNAPKSRYLSGIGLLGAIGEYVKESEYSNQAKRVIGSLADTEMLLIQYGDASSYGINHYIIDIAKSGRLNQIIDSLYYAKLYNQEKRKSSSVEYNKFDLFASRFLQLFTPSSFADFLSFRAEYPASIELLFTTYFTKMGQIDSQIVSSARVLGKWLNKVAYFAAKNEIKEGSTNSGEDLRKAKAKILVELESSAFSAKSGTALIAQVVTRAGRLSNLDVPEDAALFMEKVMSEEELSLDDAKNLLIAFSRLINKTEKKEIASDDDEEEEEQEDLSNI